MDKKLTDNEIIKALECCGNIVDSTCKGCVYHETYNASCVVRLMRDALDLINRQKAENEKNENIIRIADKTIETQQTEIERLTNKLEQQEEMMANLGVELTTMRSAANSYKLHYKEAQAEIESLKHRKTELQIRNQELQHEKSEAIKEFAERLKTYKMQPFNYDRYLVPLVAIDEVVKEMTEQNDFNRKG